MTALPDGHDITAGARAYVHLKDGLIREGLAGLADWLRRGYDAIEDEPAADDDDAMALLLDRIGHEELRHSLIRIVHKRWPDSATYHFRRGWELMNSGHFDRACEAFATALEKKPEHWPARWGLAMIAAEEGNWRAAAKQYRVVLDSEPPSQNPGMWWTTWVCGNVKDYRNEELAYRRAIEIDPHMKDAWNNLGCCLMKQKRYAEALPILSKAIAAGTGGWHPYYNKAKALEKLQRYDEAIKVLEMIRDQRGILKTAQKEIDRLTALLSRNAAEAQPATHLESDPADLNINSEVDDTEMDLPDEGVAQVSRPTGSARTRVLKPDAVRSESDLESLLEDRIKLGLPVCDLHLRIYESDDLYGRQLTIPGLGRIDLLCIDQATNDLVVIELKRDCSNDEVVGQICRYMGWVAQYTARPGQRVRGIICLHKAPLQLLYSANMVPNLSVYEYGFSFQKAELQKGS